MTIKSNHALILNRLHQMQLSPYYATAREELALAESTIVGLEAALNEPATRAVPVEIEWPEYHAQGMGCGLEDLDITDRYEAMRYGWDEAIKAVHRAYENLK